MYHNLVLVGLLSGVAGGKTTVARMFADWGALHLDADREAHAVLREDAIRSQVVARWGGDILGSDGEVDRGRIGQIVFAESASAETELRWLEERVHPRVRARLQAQLEAQARPGAPRRLAVLDVPLLLASPWAGLCDTLIYVDTPRARRLERARRDRGWDEAMLLRREARQDSEAEKRARAQQAMDNGGDLEATRRQARSIFERLLAGPPAPRPAQPAVAAGRRAVDDDR